MAGGSPAASHFILLRQNKVTKQKATLLSATPALRSGATCGARARRGLARTRFAQTIAIPDPPGPALLGADRRGGCNKYQQPKTKPEYLKPPGHAMACPCLFWSLSWGSVFGIRTVPSWLGRAAQMEAGSGPQLFERSEFARDPAGIEQRRLPAARRRDPDCGSPFGIRITSLCEVSESPLRELW